MNDPSRTGPYRPNAAEPPTVEPPQRIGRYRIERVLGQGGFGLVYLAHDDQLQRLVALKIPHPQRLSRPEDAQAYLTEARTVAGLDHPNIVPVYDVARADGYPCFIVSKYIEGSSLARRIQLGRPTVAEAAELVATVARTLHYAHRQGLVHRDVKPGNILLDLESKPYVADFGLALREGRSVRGTEHAGTPVYMSPEQARGEGHRVDGRSDLFSLGVVFYELLTGHRPFQAESIEELREQIARAEPRPLRQWEETIPRELERICLKALARRAAERYTTGTDLADELRDFLEQATDAEKQSLRSHIPGADRSSPPSATTPVFTPPATPTPDSQPIKIVPKGLRSFDAHDADFFLELLPGPRDRDGLPDSIRFWKTRIEEADADSTFAVGLIYGPSGCGKSSLVKAGLLPRLAETVLAVYIEATAETETRLLNSLRKRCPNLPLNLGLKETLADLRRGQGLPTGKKVLLVLDQFEQFLHAHKDEENTELVQALRQCDGSRLQCVVLVRDDFWMAATRFMRELEIRLVEADNSAAVDLFPPRHAEKVLAAFGRAFGALPENCSEISKEQKQFLEQAVSGLAQDGKVISVRLALFAEMIKGKAWSPATLRAVGGAEGVGVTFLEETFCAATAPPQHRYYEKAARAVLKLLLPESGTDIKGHMRSHEELLAASGCGKRLRDFEDLLRILDSEVRLITPTDSVGQAFQPDLPAEKYYQLTHDYLVPSLRDWLTRKQKETRRGRAELLLADRAAVWNTRRENRQLPSLLQWLQVRSLTRSKSWTPPQRQMMQQAGRYHLRCAALLLLFLSLLGWGTWEVHGRMQAAGLVRALATAETAAVPDLLARLQPYQHWAEPRLDYMANHPESDRERLHAGLALLGHDPGQEEFLLEQLLKARPAEFLVLRTALQRHQEHLSERLWPVLQDGQAGPGPRFRAACALAAYDPEDPRWEKACGAVVQQMLSENPLHLGVWLEALQPVRRSLIGPLEEVFAGQTDLKQTAAVVLADYAADQPEVLARLLLDADPKQYALLRPLLEKFREEAAQRMREVLARSVQKTKGPAHNTRSEEEGLAQKQAQAAVTLLHLGQAEAVWLLFRHRPDPEVRSQLIWRSGLLGVNTRLLLRQLEEEKDVSARRALILSLGEYSDDQLQAEVRRPLTQKLLRWYRDDPDPGIHGAIDWLLRHSKEGPLARPLSWGQAKELQRIDNELKQRDPDGQRRWYVNGQGQTMVLVPGQVEFLMGSPPGEADRDADNETPHRKRISRGFAIASKAVTVEQFQRFCKEQPDIRYKSPPRYSPEPSGPIISLTWFEAVRYCNWLSEKEGIPRHEWCYPEPIEEGMKPHRDYLKRKGYRLPTEAEWEFACRAQAVTSRYYGSSLELLPRYAWFLKNSDDRTWPVGQKRPNDLGLFDMHGNIWNWCQNPAGGYRAGENNQPSEDEEDEEDRITDRPGRSLRGGSFSAQPPDLRSASRFDCRPSDRYDVNGLRLARTYD